MKFSFINADDNPFFESKQVSEWIYWIALSLVMTFVLIVRIRLLDFPLERDEGEYAYMGQLMLQGIPPYKLAYNMKLPGTYGMYAFIMKVFGETTRGIHTGFLLMNLTTIFILFLLVRKLCNSFVAMISAAAYGIFALNPYILGFAAHATHFVLFWSSLGVYLLLTTIENNSIQKYFYIGIFFGIGFLMKQQAIFLILFSGFYFLYLSYIEYKSEIFVFKKFIIRGIFLVLGTLLPFLVIVLLLAKVGVLSEFWYWTFQYASKYAGMSTLSEGWKNFSTVFLLLSFGYKSLWILTGFGFLLSFFIKQKLEKKIFLTLLVFFSFLTTTPGLYFREHYFIVFIPFAFIYFGIALEYFRKLLLLKLNLRWSTLLIFAVFIYVFQVKAHKDYYLKADPVKLSRLIYGVNPFPEAIKIAEYIKSNTNESDRIAILGSEPEIYFYSNRKSATGYIYMYPLMEIHPYSKEMQKGLVLDIENQKPTYLIYVNKNLNHTWGILENSETYLLDWFEKNKFEHYDLVGKIEILALDKTIYLWGDEAKNYIPKSDYYIEILRKK